MRYAVPVFLAVLLTACSQSYLVNDDPDYPYNLPPIGSTLVLKRPLTIPGDETRIFLQRGEPMRKSAFDRYEASCSFEVRKLSESPREIQPDNFLVTRVERLTQEVVRRDPPAARLVRVDVDDDGAPMVVRGYHLWLGSERQPDVMRMTCRGHFDDPVEAYPPSLNDVRRSLGDYAELVLAI